MAVLLPTSLLATNSSKQILFRPSPVNVRVWSNNNMIGRRSCTPKKAGVSRLTPMKCLSTSTAPDTDRPLVDFQPGILGDYFTSISISDEKLESYSAEVEILKETVKDMFLNLTNDFEPMETIKFIYVLYRLGLSYHFEELIERQLNQIFHSHLPLDLLLSENNDYDLHRTALAFLMFRMHGYRISSDVFKKFKDQKDGKFKESLVSEIRGLLSLYEASFLSVHGEDILDEAKAFAKAHMIQVLAEVDDHDFHIQPHLRSHTINALRLPMYRSIQRWEVRKYIDFYENEETRNETLLKLAKVDYNRLQLLHQQELSQLSKRWTELKLAEKLPYVRTRFVENYIWSALNYEPRYAPARRMLYMMEMLILYVDDTYDSYSTHDERKLFTEAIQRWDDDFLHDDQVPNYLKVLYKLFQVTFREYENDVITQGRSFSVQYVKNAVKEMVMGYHLESEWLKEGQVSVPSFEDYLGPALVTANISTIASSFFMGMGEIAGVKEFKWLSSNPKICRAAALIIRVRDDIQDHQFQKECKLHIASSVDCYMKEYAVSEEKAIEELKKMCETAWKDINEEFLRPDGEVPKKLLQVLVNIARLIEITFMDDADRYMYPQLFQDIFSQLLVEEIPI